MESPPNSAERNRRKPTPEFTWEDLATASLPVLACFIGGATAKWAEGIIIVLLGLLLLANPPRFSLGPVFHGILLALVVCGGLAFLPASWFSQPAWRLALVDDFGTNLPSTLSVQPWISGGCLLSFLAGLCWFYYVAGGDVEVRAARRQLRIFAIEVIILAALAIVLYRTHASLPFWHNERNFGPFPNRNQTASLFGITAVLIVACAHDEIRHGKKRWVFWLLGLAIVVAALILNFSRAGIALLLLGAVVWLLILILRSGSLAKIAVGLSTLLIMLTGLLIFGGKTLERFQLHGAATATVTSDLRWRIFHDTLDMIRASPWPGVGLGNFEPVFGIFRNASSGPGYMLHPESDWLWLGAEMGWPAVALLAIGTVLFLRRAFPFVNGTNQWFRLATLIAVMLFALHGMVDVSGHRVGTAYAAIFLLGMTVRRPLRRIASVALTNSFRGVGFLLVLLGLTWIVAVYRALPLPGSVGLEVERHRAATAKVGRNFSETINDATQGLVWAPLDWRLYFTRALGEIGAQRPPIQALDDFRRARFLESNSFEVPYQEGLAWIMRDRVLALTAWNEALRRAGPVRAEVYSRMLTNAYASNQTLARSLEELANTDPDLTLELLGRVSANSFQAAIERFLERDPSLQSLTEERRARFFRLWVERGDSARLKTFIEAHPEWLGLAWPGIAREQAKQGDFHAAFALGERFGERPKLPEAPSGLTSEQLQKRFFANPDDYAAGLALFQQQTQENKLDESLVTVRRFTSQPNPPAYFHFLEAQAWAAKNNWERAWQAWNAYEKARTKPR